MPSGCHLRRMASASMPMPMRSSERKRSRASWRLIILYQDSRRRPPSVFRCCGRRLHPFEHLAVHGARPVASQAALGVDANTRLRPVLLDHRGHILAAPSGAATHERPVAFDFGRLVLLDAAGHRFHALLQSLSDLVNWEWKGAVLIVAPDRRIDKGGARPEDFHVLSALRIEDGDDGTVFRLVQPEECHAGGISWGAFDDQPE